MANIDYIITPRSRYPENFSKKAMEKLKENSKKWEIYKQEELKTLDSTELAEYKQLTERVKVLEAEAKKKGGQGIVKLMVDMENKEYQNAQSRLIELDIEMSERAEKKGINSPMDGVKMPEHKGPFY